MSEVVRQQSELFFGLVGAIGTDLNRVAEILEKYVKQVNFVAKPIKLSLFFKEIEPYASRLEESPADVRLGTYMTAGDDFRKDTGLADAVAHLAINEIKHIRTEANDGKNEANTKIAYIINSFKHKKEVETLRRVYGSAFFSISVYAPRDLRKETLAKRIAKSYNDGQFTAYFEHAERLMKRDESEIEDAPFGQDVRRTFPLGDVFIDASNAEKLELSLKRFIELVFANTFNTPTNDEFGMFMAHASAKRTASLARQVGSVILNEKGDILAAGMNEVPRPGGGIHTSDQKPDLRNWRSGADPNDERKTQLLGDMLTRLAKLDILKDEKRDIGNLINELRPKLKNAHLMNIIEFTREVHAEMAAITSAARNTISVDNSTLYTTTFPCHDCTKHIIASGIKRVVYVEPYPKSLAYALYSNFITVDESCTAGKVGFESFVGISPRRYMELFEMVDRKDDLGKVIEWIDSDAKPRVYEPARHYLFREDDAISFFGKILEVKGVKLKFDLLK
jgi:deoxycytidylate deaminase